MLEVKIDKGKSLDSALKELKSKVSRTKLIKNLRDGQYYESKSVKKRFEKLKASYIQNIKNSNE